MGVSTAEVWTEESSSPQDGVVSEVDPKAFGRRLTQARSAAGFDSQRALAAAADVSHTIVGLWERGEHLPKARQVRALAELLDDPELLEFAGLTSEELIRAQERIDVLEEKIGEFLEGQAETNRFLKKLAAEIAELRRKTGRD